MNTLSCVNSHGFHYKQNSVPAVLDKLSTAGYNSCQGAYGSRLLNANYTGPLMTLRTSTNSATSNFYGDIYGNLTTGTNGSGTSLANWLVLNSGNTTYAFITTLFDQSVTCTNNGTQATATQQPIYDVASKILNFGYNGSMGGGIASPQGGILNLPNGTVPYGNTPYTVTMKHRYSANTIGGWLGSGVSASSQCNNFRYNWNTPTSAYNNYWYGADLQSGTYAINNVITFKYNNTTPLSTLYINGTSNSTNARANRANNNLNCTMGKTTSGSETLQGELYYMYIFGSALSDADRLIIEATTFT